MPYSLLVWDDAKNLPIPAEIQEITKDIKWEKFEWHVVGLPTADAKYSVVDGKTLYLSELPNGDCKTEKMSDFTGNISIGGYFVDDNTMTQDGFNYFVNFIVTILKGEIVEVKLYKVNKQPIVEYKAVMADFEKDIDRVIRISSSWWFKYLYRPWFLTVRSIGFVCVWIIKLINDGFVWFINFLTPL